MLEIKQLVWNARAFEFLDRLFDIGCTELLPLEILEQC